MNISEPRSSAQLLDTLAHAPRRERFLVVAALGNQRISDAKGVSAMHLPAYYLPRPAFTLDAAAQAACTALLHESMAQPVLDLTGRIPVPLWQFCAYLTDTQPVLLHASNNPSIHEFEPRQSNDSNPFGNRSAVFAASDGIWPMFFAIVDRSRPCSMVNGCVRVTDATGVRSAPFYYFSISAQVRAAESWRSGTLYMLPRDSFEQHPVERKHDLIYEAQEWASLKPVRPYAKISFAPHEFPFLAQIHGHDDALIARRAQDDPDGWPWLEDA